MKYFETTKNPAKRTFILSEKIYFMKNLFLYFLFIVTTASNLSAQKIDWVKSYRNTSSSWTQNIITDFKKLNNGDIITIGYFRDSVDFDTDTSQYTISNMHNEDIFITRLDSNANLIWVKTIQGMYTQTTHRLAIDSDENLIVTGVFGDSADFDPNQGVYPLAPLNGYDGFILKLDSNGNLIWANRVGNIIYFIEVDQDDNIYAAGEYYYDSTDFDFGPGVYTLPDTSTQFILKIDENANLIWAKAVDFYPGFLSITENHLYTSAYFNETMDADPGPQITNVTPTSPGSNIAILKLDTSANLIWVRSYNSSNLDANDFEIDLNENIYITGEYSGNCDFDPSSNVHLETSSNFLSDIYQLKLNSNGDFISVKTFGNMNEDKGTNIEIDNHGNIYLAGNFRDSIDLDEGTGNHWIYSDGFNNSGFIAKFDSSDNLI